MKLKFISYASDLWNFLDIITLVAYIVGLLHRVVPTAVCGTCFYAARIIFAFSHMLFFFRILHMFAVHPELGPKLVMIGKMVRWLYFFCCFCHINMNNYCIISVVCFVFLKKHKLVPSYVVCKNQVSQTPFFVCFVKNLTATELRANCTSNVFFVKIDI